MTKTEDLIAKLAAHTPPVHHGAAARRFTLALVAGGAAAMLLLTLTIGDPFLGTEQLGVMTFGVKMAFTVAMLLMTGHFLFQASRPGHRPRHVIAWLAAPPVALGLLAALFLARAPESAREQLVFGDTWQTCLTSVTLLAVPVFIALLWAFRRLAPTDLKLAGTLAGAASASTSALVYALHCPETSPAFVLTWYGLAIIAATIGGRLFGPRLLRW